MTPRDKPSNPERRNRRGGRRAGRRADDASVDEILESIDDVVWSSTPSREIHYISRAFETVYGVPRERLEADPGVWRTSIHEDDRERVEAALAALRAAETVSLEFRIRRPDGEVRHLHYRARCVKGEDGEPHRFVGITRDVTEAKRLENQLRQAQRMEAVGRLAGGIAHDFNNLLTTIVSHAEMLEARLDADPASVHHVNEISRAASRATALTHRLLALGRRQFLQPRPVNVNVLVASIVDLLRPMLGSDVTVETKLDPALWPVHADPAQLEHVVLNLAVNARDAMPAGGRLLIETRNVEAYVPMESGPDRPAPGAFVLLRVEDTGHGMDAETAARAFEPFFTTKGAGNGTGLGLSTAYGIVRQSGGDIRFGTAPGRGTTFVVALPRHAAAPAAEATSPLDARDVCGGETVLLAEDEAELRDLARDVLEESGYRVLAAEDGAHALDLADRHAGPIDLVVTDLTMPRVGGRRLVETLRARRRGFRVLVMSGYADPGVLDHPALRDAGFLPKPFGPAELLGAVRAALDDESAT